eukprot:TRINITY_DN24734_c0_g1_i1.p1 TRINITY_DN24734_c0_g1~~TRINITY_DN24734_c0_g1_i1.p1  ORF type:complete len:878 (+),score=77.16 TRINITY_DN24734_c0_g1_i1:34-2667(+)
MLILGLFVVFTQAQLISQLNQKQYNLLHLGTQLDSRIIGGSLDVDHFARIGGEALIRPKSGDEVTLDNIAFIWTPLQLSTPIFSDLPFDYFVDYFSLALFCQRQVQGSLAISADDTAKVWLDNKLLGAINGTGTFSINLDHGWHQLLFKHYQEIGISSLTISVLATQCYWSYEIPTLTDSWGFKVPNEPKFVGISANKLITMTVPIPIKIEPSNLLGVKNAVSLWARTPELFLCNQQNDLVVLNFSDNYQFRLNATFLISSSSRCEGCITVQLYNTSLFLTRNDSRVFLQSHTGTSNDAQWILTSTSPFGNTTQSWDIFVIPPSPVVFGLFSLSTNSPVAGEDFTISLVNSSGVQPEFLLTVSKESSCVDVAAGIDDSGAAPVSLSPPKWVVNIVEPMKTAFICIGPSSAAREQVPGLVHDSFAITSDGDALAIIISVIVYVAAAFTRSALVSHSLQIFAMTGFFSCCHGSIAVLLHTFQFSITPFVFSSPFINPLESNIFWSLIILLSVVALHLLLVKAVQLFTSDTWAQSAAHLVFPGLEIVLLMFLIPGVVYSVTRVLFSGSVQSTRHATSPNGWRAVAMLSLLATLGLLMSIVAAFRWLVNQKPGLVYVRLQTGVGPHTATMPLGFWSCIPGTGFERFSPFCHDFVDGCYFWYLVHLSYICLAAFCSALPEHCTARMCLLTAVVAFYTLLFCFVRPCTTRLDNFMMAVHLWGTVFTVILAAISTEFDGVGTLGIIVAYATLFATVVHAIWTLVKHVFLHRIMATLSWPFVGPPVGASALQRRYIEDESEKSDQVESSQEGPHDEASGGRGALERQASTLTSSTCDPDEFYSDRPRRRSGPSRYSRSRRTTSPQGEDLTIVSFSTLTDEVIVVL